MSEPEPTRVSNRYSDLPKVDWTNGIRTVQQFGKVSKTRKCRREPADLLREIANFWSRRESTWSKVYSCPSWAISLSQRGQLATLACSSFGYIALYGEPVVIQAQSVPATDLCPISAAFALNAEHASGWRLMTVACVEETWVRGQKAHVSFGCIIVSSRHTLRVADKVTVDALAETAS